MTRCTSPISSSRCSALLKGLGTRDGLPAGPTDTFGFMLIDGLAMQEEQLHFLSANHCHEAQGYLVAKPMPPADMEDWYDSWESTRLNSLIA